MTELYTVKITGILASDAGNPSHTWMADSLPDIVRAVFDINFTAEIFATHEDGRIEFIGNAGAGMWANERIYQASRPIKDPDNIINDALDDANGFYEMFEGTEGVEERVERLHQAMKLMDTPTSVIVKVNAVDATGFASHEEADDPNVPDTCPECGQSFERHHHQQKYCGDVCRKARNARWYRETYAKEVK